METTPQPAIRCPSVSPAERYAESLYPLEDALDAIREYWRSLGAIYYPNWIQRAQIAEMLIGSPERRWVTPSGAVWLGDPRRGNLKFIPPGDPDVPEEIRIAGFLRQQRDPTA